MFILFSSNEAHEYVTRERCLSLSLSSSRFSSASLVAVSLATEGTAVDVVASSGRFGLPNPLNCVKKHKFMSQY